MEDENPRNESKPEFPLGRPGDAREPGAAWTTGASFVVDGGYLLVSPSSMPQDLD
jgi:hypothetical protein